MTSHPLKVVSDINPHFPYCVFDYCSMGAATCKQAVELVGSISEKAQVIYAQTDSVFVRFKDASIDDAIKLGTQAAEIVSQAFLSPIVLKFERVIST